MTSKINLLSDCNIPFLNTFFDQPVSLELFDPDIGPQTDQLKKADALLIRTVTKVDEKMLRSAPELKIICSATSGYDHMNFALLKTHGIETRWASGCNAQSVAEYVASALIAWAEDHDEELNHLTVGVVGAGHAGSATAQLLARLGCNCIAHDPPREEREPGWKGASIPEVLNCDILTLHVGLNQYPEYPTFHWLDEEKLKSGRAKLIINASRGGVIDESALKKHHVEWVLDVWENEPQVNPEIVLQSRIATPHIAGYSRQSKYRGTRMSAEAIYRFFGINPELPDELRPKTELPDADMCQSTVEFLSELHPMFEFHQKMQETALENDPKQRSSGFLKLRVAYPSPDEFAALQFSESHRQKFPELAELFS